MISNFYASDKKNIRHIFKFLLFTSLCLLIAVNGLSQRFIYIQSQSNQPFYVLINGKNYSSTINGYCIIAPLQPQNYTLEIGFPKSINKEISFDVNVTDTDQGFIFINSPQPQLLNLQSSTLQKNVVPQAYIKANPPALISNTINAEGALLQAYSTINAANSLYADTVQLSIFPNSILQLTTNNPQNCILASEQIFLDTRLAIVAQSSTTNMLLAAQKQLSKYCFSVEQCKNLSYVFLDESTKLTFFQSAYSNIYDKQNVKSLLLLFSNQQHIKTLKQQWNLQ